MSSARFCSRRPVFRCLNAPRLQNPPIRHLFREPQPKSRIETDALFAKSAKKQGIDLNSVSVHRADALRRAYHARRRNWLALGATISMIMPIILINLYDVPLPEKENTSEEEDVDKSTGILGLFTSRPIQNDAPRKATEEFQGKKVVIAAGDKVLAAPASNEHPTVSDSDAVELVETGTSYVPYFPKTISLPSTSGSSGDVTSEEEYTLLGLGIRRVSFLKVQVYVVGLYVKTTSLSTLQNHLINTVNPSASALIPGEKDALRNALLDGEKSNEVWESILSRHGSDGVEMALRIVPTRGTDFNHLRDGLMRGITGRTDEVNRKQASLLRLQAAESQTIALPKPVQESEYSDESFGAAMKDFKNMFASRGSAAKGSVLLLARDREGALTMLYQPLKKTKSGEVVGELANFGTVRDERVGRLLWLLYLGGKDVSSEEARRSVVEGCVRMVERPVGTVETMVQ